MHMSIKVKKKNAKAALKLLLFATYNFFYAFYMAGYLSRNIYLFAMAFFCFVCMVEYYTHPHQHIGRAETKPMADEWKCPYHNGRMFIEMIER